VGEMRQAWRPAADRDRLPQLRLCSTKVLEAYKSHSDRQRPSDVLNAENNFYIPFQQLSGEFF
jgi:hypothetical protein